LVSGMGVFLLSRLFREPQGDEQALYAQFLPRDAERKSDELREIGDRYIDRFVEAPVDPLLVALKVMLAEGAACQDDVRPALCGFLEEDPVESEPRLLDCPGEASAAAACFQRPVDAVAPSAVIRRSMVVG